MDIERLESPSEVRESFLSFSPKLDKTEKPPFQLKQGFPIGYIYSSLDKSITFTDKDFNKTHTHTCEEEAYSGLFLVDEYTIVAYKLKSGVLDVFSVQEHKQIGSLIGHGKSTLCVCGVKIEGEGVCISTGSKDKSIITWSMQKMQPLKVLKGHAHHVTAITQLTSGDLITGSKDASVRLWIPSVAKCIRLYKHFDEYGISSIRQLEYGRVISISISPYLPLRIWDPYTGDLFFNLHSHSGFPSLGILGGVNNMLWLPIDKLFSLIC